MGLTDRGDGGTLASLGDLRPDARRSPRRATSFLVPDPSSDLPGRGVPHVTPVRLARALRRQNVSGSSDRSVSENLRITPATRAERHRRLRRILDLEAEGWSVPDIAEAVGVSERTVYRDLDRAEHVCTCPVCGIQHARESASS